VDSETELLIRDALQVLMRGRTTLAIAHRLSTVQDMDQILVLHRGEVREAGTHQELLARRGIYHRLYQLQFPGAAGVAAGGEAAGTRHPADDRRPGPGEPSASASADETERARREAEELARHTSPYVEPAE